MNCRTKCAATYLALLFACSGHAAALAQPSFAPNCADPFTQSEINMCARAEDEAADAEMSAVYDLLLAQLQDQDRSYAENGPEFVGAEILLRESQDAWSRSRSDLCAIPGLTFRGGSMRPAAVASCMASLALSRAEELRWLLE
jgi:uncharacterized protein YecT (DUF1311 family)